MPRTHVAAANRECFTDRSDARRRTSLGMDTLLWVSLATTRAESGLTESLSADGDITDPRMLATALPALLLTAALPGDSALLFSDDFNRTDSSGLGTSWAIQSG